MNCNTYFSLIVGSLVLLTTYGSAGAELWPSSKAAVLAITQETDRLQAKIDAAEQMQQIVDVNEEMSTRYCRKETDALDRAQGDEIQKYLPAFNQCYSGNLGSVVSRYPKLVSMHSYYDLNDRYRELQKRYFKNEQTAEPGVLLARLRKELQSFRNEHDPMVGIITAYTKEAHLINGKTSTAVKDGIAVKLHDKIVTDRYGLVRLEFMDYLEKYDVGPSIVDIGPSSSVKVEKFVRDSVSGYSNAVVDILKGTFRALIRGLKNGSRWSVRAGTTVCGNRGTEFEISFDPDTDTASIRVYSGSMEVKTPHEVFMLKAGQQVTVERGYRSPIRPILDAPPS